MASIRAAALALAALLSVSMISGDVSAMPASGLASVAAQTADNSLQDVRFVCGPHRCWWGPGPYWVHPYRYWAPHPYWWHMHRWGWRRRWW